MGTALAGARASSQALAWRSSLRSTSGRFEVTTLAAFARSCVGARVSQGVLQRGSERVNGRTFTLSWGE